MPATHDGCKDKFWILVLQADPTPGTSCSYENAVSDVERPKILVSPDSNSAVTSRCKYFTMI